MRKVTARQRRQSLTRRHHLAGDAEGPEEVARAVVALHATDPASVYLSVLARSSATSIADVAAAMYERRSLVRWLCMRRTLFLVRKPDVPMMQAAVSSTVAAALRTRLVNQLTRNGTQPPLEGDVTAWVDSLADDVEQLVRRQCNATGAQLGADEPRLRTSIMTRAPSDQPQKVTGSLLQMLSAQGAIVRGKPTGAWTSRHHYWEHVDSWWPEGLPVLESGQAERELAHRWLSRFGPATVDDLHWWTGWNKTTTHRALAGLRLEDVDLHGQPGICLAGDEYDEREPGPPGASLLPALDPTAMGWKHRDWFLSVDKAAIFDRAGNIGPTVWWDGEIIGSWAITATGEIRTWCPVDRGAEAHLAVAEEAARLQQRLEGDVVTPAVRTPLEKALAGQA